MQAGFTAEEIQLRVLQSLWGVRSKGDSRPEFVRVPAFVSLDFVIHFGMKVRYAMALFAALLNEHLVDTVSERF